MSVLDRIERRLADRRATRRGGRRADDWRPDMTAVEAVHALDLADEVFAPNGRGTDTEES